MLEASKKEAIKGKVTSISEWDLQKQVLAVEALTSFIGDNTISQREIGSKEGFKYKGTKVNFEDMKAHVPKWCETKEEFILALHRVSYFLTGCSAGSTKDRKGTILIEIGGGELISGEVKSKPFNDISEAVFIGLRVTRSRFHEFIKE